MIFGILLQDFGSSIFIGSRKWW